MTKLYIVRHAEAEGNLYQRFHGHTNGQITENGYRQLERLQDYMKERPVDIIYTSDLDRTVATAEAVRAGREIPLIRDNKLREIYAGNWEDMPFTELKEAYPDEFAAWEQDPANCTLPGGESIAALQERAVNEIKQIVAENRGKCIAVVTHGTVIRTLCCYFRRLPLERINAVGWVDNASVTAVEWGESPHILYEGEKRFLADLSTLDRQDWWQDFGTLIHKNDID